MKHFLVLFFIITSVYASAYADNIYFNHLGNKDGLPQINVLSIYQDETGAMWFGTVEGICRYNGKDTESFTSSSKDTGLTQNIIYAICGDKKGNIYIKADYDLVKYNLSKQKFETIRQGNTRALFYKDNILWYVTDSAIYQYINGEIREYCKLEKSTGRITYMYIDNDGAIWLGADSGITILYSNNYQNRRKVLDNTFVTTIYEDSKQNIWVGTANDGVFLLSKNAQQLAHYTHMVGQQSLSNNQIRTIVEDRSGKMWIGTFFGLNRYDPVIQEWHAYIHVDNIPHSISHTSIFSLYEDTQGTMWAGTYFGGVNYFNTDMDKFRFYNANHSSQNHLSYPFIGKMAEDDAGNLWICTEGGGLNCLNLATRQFSHYMYDEYNYESTSKNNLKSIWYHQNKLYIGLHNGGLVIFDTTTKKYRTLTSDKQNPYSLSSNSIRDMQYYKGDLYVLTSLNLMRMDIENEKFYSMSDDPTIKDIIKKDFIYAFYIDSKDRLWISLSNRLRYINLKTKKHEDYTYNKDNPNSIGKFRITSILETDKGDLYFGTTGSGLFKYRPETNDFETYTKDKKSLVSDFCYHIAETSAGNLIILSNSAITVLDPQGKGKIIFESSSNFPITGFFQGSSSFITKDHEIFIGGVNGLVSVFEPDLKNITSSKYNLYFDKLFINNKLISPDDNSNILKETISSAPLIELKHNQNNIMLEFASSNYIYQTIQQYEYKLEGFDREWNLTTSNTLIYTNINPGKYKLLVREANKGNEGKMCSLDINISPPIYASTLAFMLYCVLFILSMIAIVKFSIWRSRLNSALEMERREKEQIEKLNQAKLSFFTNISHELRTPLTLIIGQTEMALKEESLDTELHNKISKVYKNATHMRNLISELLDFRKQELGYIKLKATEVDLVEYIKEIYESFTEYAQQLNISYKFECEEKSIAVFIDPVQYHKAIYNLLSNAFKYTQAGGEVILRISLKDEYVSVQVEDNGIGISTEDLSKIFERFYQVEYRSSKFSLGTGIGLALTKQIVESHKGIINVTSASNKGSIFETQLLLGNKHFIEEELISNQDKYVLDDSPETQFADLDPKPVFSTNDDPRKPSVLIVEDSNDVMELLVDAFSDKYCVYTASNGKIGFETALEIQPDLIVSDVMMPEMSGKEMCYKIKNNIHVSHIPVLLLTAQTSTNQTIEGYMYGADDYVTKPFNIEVLLSRCYSLIRNRKLFYQSVTKENRLVVTPNILTEYEQEFIDKATKIVKDNFDNPKFDMNTLAAELGLSRTKLYSQLKEISGMTPNEFTLNIKLKEACYLLENAPNMNISDIAYSLGFSTAKYFRKTFKTFYNVSPMQWKKNKDPQYTSENEEDDE
ncbi:two-component regulator propeller domain-containing protein [Dysgonomonas sp. BGC7]|uniref:hybrid sensor histidine kinase/response regulator transcription factor n=1 Tax=Dysgonomonas sp. BGC7 TaxID=1658008 RepID=UPI0006802AC9|nr:two-component regulator propeller domain-containing protein [Dysgonomonas sp. BGC7]MBD8387820.1 response regulator [Dysgonomonas sp. BGC7]